MHEPTKIIDFDAIRLRVASPETIRHWSYGEVTKPETVNYRTQKPEKSGLFAEEIFGPTKDWECYCGKYKKIRYKGIVCDKCGVEVTHSLVRRERMGHIELATPVAHIWFLRSIPSKIGIVLDLSVQALEKVIYFTNFIITDVDDGLKAATLDQLRQEYKSKHKQIENEGKQKADNAVAKGDNKGVEKSKAEMEKRLKTLEEEFVQVEHELKELVPMKIISEQQYQDMSMRFGHVFDAGIGGEAVRQLLGRLDLEKTMVALKTEIEEAKGAKHDRLVRRAKLLKSLKMNGVKPEWMMLNVIPVIPPDLRPMVALDGGRFATSDLNDLYRRVINRNNRLKKLLELNAPEVIVRNEKRMLQEAVDALIDNNARRSKTVTASTGQKRQLRSIADILKGKQGRFRQNLLGKRTDYSGRSVIVVGPNLNMDECGLPKRMALELFKPFVMSEIIKQGLAHNIRSASRIVESERDEVWDILEGITQNTRVLLNRAPTLHRLGIQAFKPRLIEGKAIRIHPMVCTAFNADFDGDQMAVHVLLTEQAKKEAEELMAAERGLLKPATGTPVATPKQDVALGCFYISTIRDRADGLVKTFGSFQEAKLAYKLRRITLQEKIKVRPGDGRAEAKGPDGALLETTVGRIFFNEIMPEKIPFYNEQINVKKLGEIIRLSLEFYGEVETAHLLDAIKNLGFKYVTKSGYSLGMDDFPSLTGKTELLGEGDKRVEEIEEQYEEGLLTQSERHTKIIDTWTEIKDRIVAQNRQTLDPLGPVFAMIESGARGSWGQLTQVIGMKGLVSSPSGEIIELPVKGNFKEGFDVLEFFISSHGTRKGLSDTALRTANAGYLTRRLVDVAQDVVVLKEDCGDTEGAIITEEDSQVMGEKLSERVVGRFALADIKAPGKRKPIVAAGELITEAAAREIANAKLTEIHVRSVLKCLMPKGVCQKCYGFELGHNKLVKMGTAVGIIAAQSIGEPGTQLTMRTFHTGGVAGTDITKGLPRVEELFEARAPKKKSFVSEIAGVCTIESAEGRVIESPTGKKIFEGRRGQKIVKVKAMDGTEKEYIIPLGYKITVKEGDLVNPGDMMTEGHVDLTELFALKGKEAVQKYILKEIQDIYSSQGQKLNDKHIETIIRQLFSRMLVTESGDTELLPGEVVEKAQVATANKILKKGEKPAVGQELFLGISKVALSTQSFLSAASFMETARVLINAAVTGKIDFLDGLKENVIIGRLIPAGTGYDSRMGLMTTPVTDVPAVVEAA
ncbi:MAG: rpoC [Candidatus Magasanikbacteria bacterium]|nr:rpoC [Candidatus Magasanikbacteria bacterium]